MATISLSAGWVTNVGTKLTTNVSGDLSYWYYMPLWNPGGTGSSANYGFTEIRMYKGTPPAYDTNWASKIAYDADLLVKWDWYTSAAVVTGDTVKFYCTAPQAAGQSGTATWFAFVMTARETNNWGWHGIGTVGTVGSGADMVIGSTSIISGALYSYSDLKFIVPSSFTY